MEKENREIKFCSYCGEKLIINKKRELKEFDKFTGEEIRHTYVQCPNDGKNSVSFGWLTGNDNSGCHTAEFI